VYYILISVVPSSEPVHFTSCQLRLHLNLPEILGVVALPAERLPDYVSRPSAQLPVVTVTPWEPCGWIRVMPQPFIDRIRAEMPRAASPG
jgi:hypothetical protein